MINITDWIAMIPPEDKRIAYVGEHESVMREFFLPDLTYRDYAFYLDMSFDLSTVTQVLPARTIQTTQQTTSEKVDAEGVTVASTANTSKESYTHQEVSVDCKATTDIAPLSKLIREDGILLTWRVLGQQTRLSGLLRATLRAVGPSGDVKKTAMMLFTISPAVEATPAAPIELSEHEQMEQAMVLALEQAAANTYTSFEKIVEETCDEMQQTAADTYAAFEESLEKAVGSVEQVRDYVDSKTAPATDATYGTVKCGSDEVVASILNGIYMDANGMLRFVPASKAAIDGKSNPFAPIVPANLEYAVKSVGDDRYLTEEALDEKIAPATVGGVHGTIKLGATFASAGSEDRLGTGLGINTNGELSLSPANPGMLKEPSLYRTAPITVGNFETMGKHAFDGYYALASDVGDIEAALDSILAMQESLIGGGA